MFYGFYNNVDTSLTVLQISQTLLLWMPVQEDLMVGFCSFWDVDISALSTPHPSFPSVINVKQKIRFSSGGPWLDLKALSAFTWGRSLHGVLRAQGEDLQEAAPSSVTVSRGG